MPYVMVPVPEEHEEEFTRELLAISMRAATRSWDEATLRALLDGLDAPDVALVRAVSAPDRQVDRLGASELAAALGLDLTGVADAIARVNEAGASMSRGWIILTSPSTRPAHGGCPVHHLPEKAAALIRAMYR